jgi:hypothetical protein
MSAPGEHNNGGVESLEQLRSRLEAESSDGLRLLENLEDNPICCVSLDRSVPCIHVVWKRYATSTQLRFIHEHLLHMLERNRVGKILRDDTDLPMIHAEDQRWIVENWMPRAQLAGLMSMATKKPNAYFGQLAVESVHSVAPAGLTIRSFADMGQAREWLRISPPAAE